MLDNSGTVTAFSILGRRPRTSKFSTSTQRSCNRHIPRGKHLILVRSWGDGCAGSYPGSYQANPTVLTSTLWRWVWLSANHISQNSLPPNFLFRLCWWEALVRNWKVGGEKTGISSCLQLLWHSSSNCRRFQLPTALVLCAPAPGPPTKAQGPGAQYPLKGSSTRGKMLSSIQNQPLVAYPSSSYTFW